MQEFSKIQVEVDDSRKGKGGKKKKSGRKDYRNIYSERNINLYATNNISSRIFNTENRSLSYFFNN